VLALAVFAVMSRGAAQQAPATEVYLSPLAIERGKVTIGSWVNISNSPGYDNQPGFLPDSRAILFSSQRDGKQMDIYRYDIERERVTQVTNTPEGEYSPTMTPDGRTFSVIRVEADSTQRLWRFDLDGSNPRLVLADVKPVGYHAWIDANQLALYILGGAGVPATLQIADTRTGQARVAASSIGRSVLVRPGKGTVSHMTTMPAPRMLREFDPGSGATSPLVAPVEGSQDCAWLPDGRLIMARGRTIHMWTPGTDAWAEVATLNAALDAGPGSSPAIDSITRMAVSPDGRWLAFVAEPRTSSSGQ